MNRYTSIATLALVLFSALSEAQKPPKEKARVYAEPGTDTDGWAVKEPDDSAKDLRREMGNKVVRAC